MPLPIGRNPPGNRADGAPREGSNPQLRRKTIRKGHFRAGTNYASDHRKPNTARLYREIIDKRILPRLGKRRVANIGRADAAALHHEMRDVPGHANRTLGVLSCMLTMAEV